jgi:hypothetical protein
MILPWSVFAPESQRKSRLCTVAISLNSGGHPKQVLIWDERYFIHGKYRGGMMTCVDYNHDISGR